jgi:hypothetical protein
MRRTRQHPTLLALLLVLSAAPPAAALEVPLDLATLEQEYREILPGVWQRDGLDGRTEHLAIGPEGLAWALAQLHERSSREIEVYLEQPTAERWERIEDLAKTMERMRADIGAARSIGLREALRAILDRAAACDFSGTVDANAYPLNVGAGASALASWWNNCSQQGCVYCNATACIDRTCVSDSKSACSTTAVSRSCLAQLAGSAGCFSSAYASVYAQGPSVYLSASEADDDGDCGTAPLAASLSCNFVYPTVDCTGSASGGSSPYRAYWKEGNYAEFESIGSPGSGPWTYGTLCKPNSPGFQPFQIRFRVVDSTGTQKIKTWWCSAA